MARSLQELEALVLTNGVVSRVDLLKLVRLIPNSDNQIVIATIQDWIVRLEEVHAITDIDEEWLNRIISDLEQYGRIQHETINGAEPRPTFEKFRKAPTIENATN